MRTTVDQVYMACKKRWIDGMLGLTITVNACENNITEPPPADSFSGILRLIRIQGRRCTGGLDRAEAAASCACVAHQLQELIISLSRT